MNGITNMLGLRETEDFNSFDIYVDDNGFYEEFGYYPCFQIGYDDPEEVLKKDEIITRAKKITIIFDYPLGGNFGFGFKNSLGKITRKDFVSFIQSTYRHIYDEESKNSTKNISGMYNSQSTNGPYKIWGHHIGDLVIEGVLHIGNNIYTLSIGS